MWSQITLSELWDITNTDSRSTPVLTVSYQESRVDLTRGRVPHVGQHIGLKGCIQHCRSGSHYIYIYTHTHTHYVRNAFFFFFQYSEGPATGHLDTSFSWFPCVYKQMLRWFPRFQVATTCFSCSPPDLNSGATNFMSCIHVNKPLPPGDNPIAVYKYYYYYYYYTTCVKRRSVGCDPAGGTATGRTPSEC